MNEILIVIQLIKQIDPNILLSFAALIIAIIALIYTVRTYILKSGHKIRGWVGFSSDIDTNDKYPSNIIIENLKDKAIAIYYIYLKIGNNFYLEIENFRETPLIIKPFEVFNKEYDPILFYSVGMRRIKIDKILDMNNLKRILYLSTTDGKIRAHENMKIWNPIGLIFKNGYTGIIRPMKYGYKEKYYGENISYLVDIKYSNGEEQVIKLQKSDYQYKIYHELNMTKESLESLENLKKYFSTQKRKKLWNYESIKIIDWQKAIDEHMKDIGSEIIDAKPLNLFQYYFMGKYLTIKNDLELKKVNKKKKSKQSI